MDKRNRERIINKILVGNDRNNVSPSFQTQNFGQNSHGYHKKNKSHFGCSCITLVVLVITAIVIFLSCIK